MGKGGASRKTPLWSHSSWRLQHHIQARQEEFGGEEDPGHDALEVLGPQGTDVLVGALRQNGAEGRAQHHQHTGHLTRVSQGLEGQPRPGHTLALMLGSCMAIGK